MDKFGRNYKLQIETRTPGQFVQVEPPFTLNFDIKYSTLSDKGVAQFRIINLSRSTTKDLRKDFDDRGAMRKIQFNARYGESGWPTVFEGDIWECSTLRDGTDYVTNIECFGFGFAASNALSNKTFPKKTSKKEIIKSLISDLKDYGVELGAIGNFNEEITRSNSYGGNTINILKEVTGGAFFIFNGKAYCLKDNEVVPGGIEVIDSASGLLSTPIMQDNAIHLDMLFEPRVIMAQKMIVNSITNDYYNSTYRAISIHHRGMISESVCGSAVTTLGLSKWLGDFTEVTHG